METQDPLDQLQKLQELVGIGQSKSMALLNTVMTETIGMSMHNAVSAQQNAQQINNAATTSACARILAAGGAQRANAKPAPQVTETNTDH